MTSVFEDQFDGTSLDLSKWSSSDGAKFSRHNVEVVNGMLALHTRVVPSLVNANDKGWRGGLVVLESPLTYGTYRLRVRLESGEGIRFVALLWPADGSWASEVDFCEVGGVDDADRQEAHQTLHTNPGNHMAHHSYPVDLTSWQTVGVRWSAEKLEYTLNGDVKATTVTGDSGTSIPRMPMKLHIQSATEKSFAGTAEWPKVPPVEATAYVRWVKVNT